MTGKVCAIIGVGPGNGEAFARRFAAGGYRVALLSRSRDYLDGVAADIGGLAVTCDAGDAAGVGDALAAVAREAGPVEVLLYNAGSARFGSIDEVEADDLAAAWQVNTQGLFAAARAVIPAMREAGRGAIVVTGATAAVKHSAGFAAFTAAKASQRALAQSMAKYLGPGGIHVAYVIVDGVIDLPRTRRRLPDRPDEFFLRPAAIADAVWYLAHQDRSAWTFELDLRPFAEKW